MPVSTGVLQIHLIKPKLLRLLFYSSYLTFFHPFLTFWSKGKENYDSSEILIHNISIFMHLPLPFILLGKIICCV